MLPRGVEVYRTYSGFLAQAAERSGAIALVVPRLQAEHDQLSAETMLQVQHDARGTAQIFEELGVDGGRIAIREFDDHLCVAGVARLRRCGRHTLSHATGQQCGDRARCGPLSSLRCNFTHEL